MKKLLFILVLLITVVSCTVPIEDIDVKKGKEITSVYIQELPKDTVVISIDEDKLYVFEDNVVKYKVRNVENMGNDYVPIHIGIIVFWVVLSVIGIIALIVIVTD